MVTYKASELVTAALQLADLENTSFPTAVENRTYLNNAWLKIYQQCIDNGATYWLKKDTVKQGENDLPDDFYQLDYVEDERGNQIDRYQRGMTNTQQWYRILNDKLILNKCPEAVIWYNPVPETLDITDEGDVELSYPNNILYNLMVYEIAKYYKIKQHAEYDGIQDLYNEAWTMFFDMLSRDNNQNTTIKDVYAYNHFGIF